MGRRAEGRDDAPDQSREHLELSSEELWAELAALRRDHEALRRSEERYRGLFENAIDLIQVTDAEGRLLFVNEAWRQTFGYDPRAQPDLTIFDLIAPELADHCRDTFSTVLRTGLVEDIDTTFVATDGRRVALQGNAKCTYDARGEVISAQCILQDVTVQKEREAAQLRADKIASLGVLAGGIAHDFNNYLTAILGNISLARSKCPGDEEVARCLRRAERASVRAQGLTQQLLTFAKGSTSIKTSTTLGPLITESAEFATRGSRSSARCQIAADLWPALVDAGQIGQTLDNLVLNASEAMAEGGTITIRADNVVLEADSPLDLPAGRYVRIEVEDHGHGIPKPLLEQIFDPYFTTKEAGSGLGLAVCYSVVSNHGGALQVASQVGVGTTFTIYLPASADTAAPRPPEPDAVPEGHGRVLVMDDEAMIRDLVARMLSTLGYEVEVAEDGHAAIVKHERALADGRPFDLVLLDLTVPGGMGGDRALDAIRATSPATKAIISSGYAHEPRALELVGAGAATFLQKPYNLGVLARVVKEVLDAR